MPGRIRDGVLRTAVDPGPPGPPAGGLAGLRVLVPRAGDAVDPIAIALSAAGAEPIAVALVQTLPPDDPTELDDLLMALGSGWYQWVAVTSAAAVPVLVDRAEEIGSTLATLVEGTRVAAVGPATARALRAVGVEVDLVPTGASSAAALLAAWPSPSAPTGGEPVEGSRVLVPHADLAAPTLATGLQQRGWAVDEVVAYRAATGPDPEPAVRDAWTAGQIGAVLLTSGSTARAMLDLLGAPAPGTLVCCIGPSTATETERLGLHVDAVAAEQTPTGLVVALAAALAARDERSPVDPPPPGGDAAPARPTDDPSPR
jgi:uroporphyrinogen-III synthase/uroporphyrinogen III methyltransferase/synthase